MKRIVIGFALLLWMAVPVRAQTTIILVRHAERIDNTDSGLSDAGKARVVRLVEALKSSGASAVYSTPLLRTKETATPLAEALGVPVTLLPSPAGSPLDAFAKASAELILREQRGKTIVVVGHSNTTPALITALGAPAVPAIPDTQFDDLFVVQVNADGKATVIRAKY